MQQISDEKREHFEDCAYLIVLFLLIAQPNLMYLAMSIVMFVSRWDVEPTTVVFVSIVNSCVTVLHLSKILSYSLSRVSLGTTVMCIVGLMGGHLQLERHPELWIGWVWGTQGWCVRLCFAVLISPTKCSSPSQHCLLTELLTAVCAYTGAIRTYLWFLYNIFL